MAQNIKLLWLYTGVANDSATLLKTYRAIETASKETDRLEEIMFPFYKQSLEVLCEEFVADEEKPITLQTINQVVEDPSEPKKNRYATLRELSVQSINDAGKLTKSVLDLEDKKPTWGGFKKPSYVSIERDAKNNSIYTITADWSEGRSEPINLTIRVNLSKVSRDKEKDVENTFFDWNILNSPQSADAARIRGCADVVVQHAFEQLAKEAAQERSERTKGKTSHATVYSAAEQSGKSKAPKEHPIDPVYGMRKQVIAEIKKEQQIKGKEQQNTTNRKKKKRQ